MDSDNDLSKSPDMFRKEKLHATTNKDDKTDSETDSDSSSSSSESGSETSENGFINNDSEDEKEEDEDEPDRTKIALDLQDEARNIYGNVTGKRKRSQHKNTYSERIDADVNGRIVYFTNNVTVKETGMNGVEHTYTKHVPTAVITNFPDEKMTFKGKSCTHGKYRKELKQLWEGNNLVISVKTPYSVKQSVKKTWPKGKKGVRKAETDAVNSIFGDKLKHSIGGEWYTDIPQGNTEKNDRSMPIMIEFLDGTTEDQMKKLIQFSHTFKNFVDDDGSDVSEEEQDAATLFWERLPRHFT
jgi:hypothetical protein